MTSPNLHSPLVLVGLDVDVDAVSDDGSEDLNVVVDGKKDVEVTDGEMKLAELGTLDGGELELGKLLGGLEVVGRRLTDGRSD